MKFYAAYNYFGGSVGMIWGHLVVSMETDKLTAGAIYDISHEIARFHKLPSGSMVNIMNLIVLEDSAENTGEQENV